ncbi:MAG: rhamnulokinase, partial [Adlercreutzia equolifaciens]
MAHRAQGLRRDCYAAVDIGASSGRVVVGFVEDGLIRLEEVHRFDNRQVRRNGHDCWDVELLSSELVRGLALCKEAGFAPKSVGIDTWGVDFVLLDAEDNLVGDAVAYRDSRTAGMYEVADAIMAPEELYRRCGLQRQPFNTIYQLLALQREHPEQLVAADSFLMIPDYLNFLLTGEKAIEYTNASTTGLLNAETGAWDETVMEAFDIPRRLFRNVTHAGACLGPVRPEIARAIGYDTRVVLPATHDTGSAYLAVPACDLPAVFLSSGTWSLLGVENRSPICAEAAFRENFTNEGGYHFRYRFLKNIMGLWMIQ